MLYALRYLTSDDGPYYLFIIIAVLAGVFFLFRFLLTWYFKINARLKVAEEILAELKKMNEVVDKDTDL
jgi:hypothetical protein